MVHEDNAMERVKAAATAFVEAAEAIGGDVYVAELEQARKREVGAVLERLDAVRGWLSDLLGPITDQVTQFVGDDAGREFEDATSNLEAAGEVLFRLLQDLDPALADRSVGL